MNSKNQDLLELSKRLETILLKKDNILFKKEEEEDNSVEDTYKGERSGIRGTVAQLKKYMTTFATGWCARLLIFTAKAKQIINVTTIVRLNE